MTAQKSKSRIWSGIHAWRLVLSEECPDNLIIIVTPKGTGKSEQFVRKNLHDLENKKLKHGILNIKTIAASHQSTTYASYQQVIEKYQLRNYESRWSQSERFIKKNGKTLYFYGSKEQETRLTGWSLPIDRFWYDEYLNSKDNRGDEFQDKKASSTRKLISSAGREILKVRSDGKMIFTMNLHYKDKLMAPLIFENFDISKIREEVAKQHFAYRRLIGNPLWAKGISFLFLDPEINEFLPQEIKDMDYGSAWENAAMKESIPDETYNPEFVHKRFLKGITLKNSWKEIYALEPLLVGMDPASGKDEFAICFLGIDFENKKIIVIDGLTLETKNFKGVEEISNQINNFFDKALIKFYELSIHKSNNFYKNSWIFGIDSNQKTLSYDFIQKLWNFNALTDYKYFKPKYDFRTNSFISIASKNGNFRPIDIADFINDQIKRKNIIFIKNSFNLKLLNQMNIVRSSKQTNGDIKIISNGGDDAYDAFRMAIEALIKRQQLKNLFLFN